MEIKSIIDAIEARVVLNRPTLKAQAMLLQIHMDGHNDVYEIGVVLDPTKLTFAVIDDVKKFNDEASNTITFTGGKLVNNGADNALFALTFMAEQPCL